MHVLSLMPSAIHAFLICSTFSFNFYNTLMEYLFIMPLTKEKVTTTVNIINTSCHNRQNFNITVNITKVDFLLI